MINTLMFPKLLSGIEKDFDLFDTLFKTQIDRNANFPKTSIFLDNDDNLVFEFALAGFKKEEISIDLAYDKITVYGKKEKKTNEVKKIFTNQIAYRDFTISYKIPSFYIDSKPEAKYADGILTIKIKPKKEAIESVQIVSIE